MEGVRSSGCGIQGWADDPCGSDREMAQPDPLPTADIWILQLPAI